MAEQLAATGRGSAVDVDLVRRGQAGDEAAFARLVDLYVDRMLRIALGMVREDADARDAVQDAFLQAWRDLPRLRDPEAFGAWLGRVTINACRSHLRRERRHVREIAVIDGSDEGLDVADRGKGFADRHADLDELERAFDRLTQEQRTLLVLHHGEHLDLAAIAVMVGIPVTKVKSRLFTARRALERALEDEQR